MKIYELDLDVSKYAWVKTVEDVNADFIQMFDGRKLKDSWNVMELERMPLEEERPLGDTPCFTIPVFSKKALDALMPLMKDDIEVLPFKFEGSFLYGINVTTVLDNAIDYDLSEYRMFRDGKRIKFFDKYVFKNDAILGKNIFKISDKKIGYIFVSQGFCDTIHNCGLEGFNLKLVYEG